MEVVYTAEATTWGGREGRIASSDGVLDFELRIPAKTGLDLTPHLQLPPLKIFSPHPQAVLASDFGSACGVQIHPASSQIRMVSIRLRAPTLLMAFDM